MFACSRYMQKPIEGKASEPVSPDELVLSVAIYHPRRLVKVQEFLVLGSQKLSDLRDKMYAHWRVCRCACLVDC